VKAGESHIHWDNVLRDTIIIQDIKDAWSGGATAGTEMREHFEHMCNLYQARLDSDTGDLTLSDYISGRLTGTSGFAHMGRLPIMDALASTTMGALRVYRFLCRA